MCGCITGEYQARSAPYNSNELTDVVEGLPAQNLLEQITELFFRRSGFRAALDRAACICPKKSKSKF
ncbi:MAG: hypothetical protein DMF38_05345 [Verrucomicrobia bacterium]|nr:MAG: hypothetical protein DMF38_05345 [Verrucomicrobiota bacterium]